MNPLPSPVPSPCVNVCRMQAATGWCEGCWRTIDEIAAWGRMDDDAKRAVWAVLASRRAAVGRGSGAPGAPGVSPAARDGGGAGR